MKTNIVDIFCMVDDFSKLFDQTIKEKSIEKDGKKRRNQCCPKHFVDYKKKEAELRNKMLP